MILPELHYKGGYKYQLIEDFVIQVPGDLWAPEDISTRFIKLNKKGVLTVRQDYAWNGADVLPDTERTLMPSLPHDVFYQLMRLGLLDAERYRAPADRYFAALCVAKGTPAMLAREYYNALQNFGAINAMPTAQAQA